MVRGTIVLFSGELAIEVPKNTFSNIYIKRYSPLPKYSRYEYICICNNILMFSREVIEQLESIDVDSHVNICIATKSLQYKIIENISAI